MHEKEILERLRHADDEVRRRTAADLIGTMCDRKIAERVAELVADPDRGVRETACRFIVQQSADYAPELLLTHLESAEAAVRNLAAEYLVQLGKRAVGAVSSILDHPSRHVRKFAVDILGDIADESGAAEVEKRLSDDDPNVVIAAIDSLGYMGAKDSADRLVQLYEAHENYRPNIVQAVGPWVNATPLSFLVEALHEGNPVVQLAAIDVLADRPDEDVMGHLMAFTDNVQDGIAALFLSALARQLERQGVPEIQWTRAWQQRLLETLEDPNDHLVSDAVKCISLGLTPDMIPHLLRQLGRNAELDDTISDVLLQYPAEAARTIILSVHDGEISPEVACRFVVFFLGSPHGRDPSTNPQILEFSSELLNRYFDWLEFDTKISAIHVVVEATPAYARQLLKTALNDHSGEVRLVALHHAVQLNGDLLSEELSKLLNDEVDDIRMLAADLYESM